MTNQRICEILPHEGEQTVVHSLIHRINITKILVHTAIKAV